MKPRMTIALKKSILYTVYHLTSGGWNFHSVFISFREQTTTLIAFRFLLHLCVEQWQSQQSSNWNHSQQSIWKSRSINYEFYVRQSREWWRCYSRNKIISINIVTLHTVSRHDTRHTTHGNLSGLTSCTYTFAYCGRPFEARTLRTDKLLEIMPLLW